MALIDEITLDLRAGDGGNGVVRWLHEKGKEFAGPSGGDGGNGGDVYAHGVRDIGILHKYRGQKEFDAERGEDGRGRSQFGKGGEDLLMDLPIGSVITNIETDKKVELLEEGDKILLLRGGRGGLGNEHFKASTNRTPEQFTPGKEGEKGVFHIELKLIADLGLIGLPNAGKSSLLNSITNASAKIGSYQFTTLEPNLGAFYGYVLADIPGLIEGASEGRGLGHKFLKHIERTGVLLHCISLEDENLIETYDTVKEELKKYSPELANKREVIVLTKADAVSKAVIEDTKNKFIELKKETVTVSIIDDELLADFKKYLSKLLETK